MTRYNNRMIPSNPTRIFTPRALPGKLSRIILTGFILVLSGCALPFNTGAGQDWERVRLAGEPEQSKLRWCQSAFDIIDDAVDAAATHDAQSVPVTGFIYLRTTRFLAALGSKIDINDDQSFDFWRSWLASTAITARTIEITNLPASDRLALQGRLGMTARQSPTDLLDDCTGQLTEFDRRRPGFNAALAATVNVADNYTDIQRVIGLYPLSRIPVIMGYEIWKHRNLPEFSLAPSKLETHGTIQYYASPMPEMPLSAQNIADILDRTSQNPLTVPRPGDRDLRQLAASFAPVFAIDRVGQYDDIAMPTVHADGTVSVNSNTAVVYVQPSWTIFRSKTMLQISYQIWFSERPSRGPFDILSGPLDGLIWRVTIAPDGRAVLYDTIHPCGCYHLFFPVPPLGLKTRQVNEPGEGTLVPTKAPVLKAGQRMVLHISSGDHYLRNLSATNRDTNKSTAYQLREMDDLRSLPLAAGGTRSLYGPQGLVRGTQRAERFILWPMGIASPGAMRQWGTHATAFTGRRHFDDPALLDNAFY